jgi:NAD(P)-dependent dehydrogenase (short-subunit alcohol dehydrogenase family)
MTLEISLSGRTVLVTGASSGLGSRFARVCSQAGAKVAVAARRTDRLEALVAEISAAGGTAAAVALDVLDEASVKAGFDAAEAALGPIDSVIANAGISKAGSSVDMAIEAFDEVIAVNLRGAYLTAREAGRRMIAAGSRETGRGRVVLIASIAAQVPLPGLMAYCASKAGVAMMGRTLAREWATRGINVNMICPGYVQTEINADWFATEAGQKQIAGFPRKRLMREEDLDVMAVYLCSDASRAVTGSLFNVDDGQIG